MSATDEQQIKAMDEAHDMGFVRQVQISGRVEWALFNADGDVVHHSENRSSAFFFAAERDFRVCLRN